MKSCTDMRKRGFFIVFDGLDGVGKTTLAKIICHKYNAQYMRALNPVDNNIISKANKDALSTSKIHNLSLGFIKNTAQEVITLNNTGVNVVLDRYIYSCIAYYYAISQTTYQDIQVPDYEKYGFPCPDIVFFLNTDIEYIMTRKANKVEDFTDFLTNNNQLFRQYVLQCLCKMRKLNKIFWIDNNVSIEIAVSQISNEIDNCLKSHCSNKTVQHYTNTELFPIYNLLKEQRSK